MDILSCKHALRYIKACEVFQQLICCACCPAMDCVESEFPNQKKAWDYIS